MGRHNVINSYDAIIRESAAAGLTVHEAAARIGVSVASLGHYGRKHGIKFRHGRTKSTIDPRAADMHSAYVAGKTLKEVAAGYGITRERVRQIITKYFGVCSDNGSAAVKAKKARAERLERLEASCMKKNGCTRAQLASVLLIQRRMVRDGAGVFQTPLYAFRTQRQNARTRGIEWQMTFWQWWTIWQKSGKWSRRGRSSGDFVMCRNGDAGPYSVENVHIAPAFSNVHESNNRSGLPVGVQQTKSGRYTAHRRFPGDKRPTQLGIFDTVDEARLAYLRSHSQQEAA